MVNNAQPKFHRPSCCTTGRQYIAVFPANLLDGPDQTGWAIPIARRTGEAILENVAWCPFCGKALQDDPVWRKSEA